MYGWDCIAPRFVIFKYIIKWYVDKFGLICYICIFIGVILISLIRAIIINIRMKEYHRIIMIVMFSIILLGGLLGVGLDIYKGNAYIP